MITAILSIWIFVWSLAAPKALANGVDDQLHQVTTLIQIISPLGPSQASGFFYNRLAPADPRKPGPQWRALEKTWLVTNRHVLLPSVSLTRDGNIFKQEVLPTALTFNLRRVQDEQLRWEPVEIKQHDLLGRSKCHPDNDVDVCVIDVGDLITQHISAGIKQGVKYIPFGGISQEHFPGGNNHLSVEAADAVIVAGYPKGFYDDVNLFPVLKAGVVGSRWGAHFKGKPCFLIDGQMFPGSSGSLVISRPTNITFKNGKVLTSPDKQFAVLGILSGESWDASANRMYDVTTSLTLLVKGAVNTAIVWYGTVIEDIIVKGVPPVPVGPTTK